LRSDAVIATGRSDYPNQVNNVLCFPFIFRGALDVGRDDDHPLHGDRHRARHRPACASGTKRCLSPPPTAASKTWRFGPEYLIPKPFDPRLIVKIAPAVAKAAMEAGRGHEADRRPRGLRSEIAAIRLSQRHLDAAHLRGGNARYLRTAAASSMPKAKDERVLRAAQIAVDEGFGHTDLGGPTRSDRKRHQALRAAHPHGRNTSPWSTQSTTRGIANIGRIIIASHSDAASRRNMPSWKCGDALR